MATTENMTTTTTENDSVALIIGRNVIASQERQREFVAANTKLWQENGARFRALRENFHVSRADFCKLIGICEKTLARFEHGLNVKSRKIIENSYMTALHKVQLQQQVVLLSV